MLAESMHLPPRAKAKIDLFCLFYDGVELEASNRQSAGILPRDRWNKQHRWLKLAIKAGYRSNLRGLPPDFVSGLPR
jgi:hypothetical protein